MDPYLEYKQRREKTPVYWEEERGLWAVYPYRYCQQVLSHPATLIPPVPDGDLGGQALAVKRRLVRISNPPAHDLAREMALRVYRGRRPAEVGELLARLLPAPGVGAMGVAAMGVGATGVAATDTAAPGVGATGAGATDVGATGVAATGVGAPDAAATGVAATGVGATVEWVGAVASVLPAMHLLAGFGFADADVGVVLRELPVILRLMAPVSDARALEAAVSTVYPIVDRQVARCFPGLTAETQAYAVSNLIGLLIQGHDATKGLLSLALLHLLRREAVTALAARDMEFFLSFVTEVLRYDSPVHNTRRVLTEEVRFGEVVVPAGATVLVVVAAANRDPEVFARPEEFDRGRVNNRAMLSFGQGIHACIAGAYCAELAAQAMSYVFHTYRSVRLVEPEPEYEPLVNVRMVKEMQLRLT